MPNKYKVYASGAGVHGRPNSPCFTRTVTAESRRDAIDKVSQDPALRTAHKKCTWAAMVVK